MQYTDILYQNEKLRKKLKKTEDEKKELANELKRLQEMYAYKMKQLEYLEQQEAKKQMVYRSPIERMVNVCSSGEDLKKILDYINNDMRNTLELEANLNEIVR